MQGFLHCVWSPRMPYSVVEKGGGGKKKKKKKVGNPIGDPVRGRDAPINRKAYLRNLMMCLHFTLVTLKDQCQGHSHFESLYFMSF